MDYFLTRSFEIQRPDLMTRSASRGRVPAPSGRGGMRITNRGMIFAGAFRFDFHHNRFFFVDRVFLVCLYYTKTI